MANRPKDAMQILPNLLETLRNHTNEMNKAAAQHSKSVTAVVTQMENQVASYRELQTQYEELETDDADLTIRYEELDSRNREYQSLFRVEKARNEGLAQRNNDLKKPNQELEQRLVDLESRYEDLAVQAHDREAYIRDLEEENKHLTSICDKVRNAFQVPNERHEPRSLAPLDYSASPSGSSTIRAFSQGFESARENQSQTLASIPDSQIQTSVDDDMHDATPAGHVYGRSSESIDSDIAPFTTDHGKKRASIMTDNEDMTRPSAGENSSPTPKRPRYGRFLDSDGIAVAKGPKAKTSKTSNASAQEATPSPFSSATTTPETKTNESYEALLQQFYLSKKPSGQLEPNEPNHNMSSSSKTFDNMPTAKSSDKSQPNRSTEDYNRDDSIESEPKNSSQTPIRPLGQYEWCDICDARFVVTLQNSQSPYGEGLLCKKCSKEQAKDSVKKSVANRSKIASASPSPPATVASTTSNNTTSGSRPAKSRYGRMLLKKKPSDNMQDIMTVPKEMFNATVKQRSGRD